MRYRLSRVCVHQSAHVEIHYFGEKMTVPDFALVFPFDELTGISLPRAWAGVGNAFIPVMRRYGVRNRTTSYYRISEYVTRGFCSSPELEVLGPAWPGEVLRAHRFMQFLGRPTGYTTSRLVKELKESLTYYKSRKYHKNPTPKIGEEPQEGGGNAVQQELGSQEESASAPEGQSL